MIAVLTRQLVSRRGSNAAHFARDPVPRWRTSEGAIRSAQRKSERAQRRSRRALAGQGSPGLLPAHQLVRRRQPVLSRHALRRGRPPGASQSPRPVGPLLRGVSRALHSAWIVVVLIAVLLGVLLVPALATRSVLLPRVNLPSTAAGEQELYRIGVPEEAQAKSSPADNSGGLRGLRVSSYTLRAGEGLSQVARRLRRDVGTLISFNGIRDARALPAGMVLSVPNGDGVKHRVRRGDSLEGIARSYAVPLEGVLDWNGLTTSVIQVGQEIFVPGARMSPSDVNRILGNLFIYPVLGRISSRFGERSDPFTGVERFHNGIDIVNRPGTNVAAAMAGVVRSVAFNGNFGRYIILSHGGGFQTMYAHLNRAVVSPGESVRQGEKIAELGTTGYSTGPHLHFSVFKNGEPVDPLRFLK